MTELSSESIGMRDLKGSVLVALLVLMAVFAAIGCSAEDDASADLLDVGQLPGTTPSIDAAFSGYGGAEGVAPLPEPSERFPGLEQDAGDAWVPSEESEVADGTDSGWRSERIPPKSAESDSSQPKGEPAAPPCTPQCEGKDCGPDGCGWSCGKCKPDYYCLYEWGLCELIGPICGNGICEEDEECADCPLDCGECELSLDPPPGSCADKNCAFPPLAEICTCFESNRNGMAVFHGPYDSAVRCLSNGLFEFWTCNPALGCSDYPTGCDYGGVGLWPMPACQGCTKYDTLSSSYMAKP